MATPTNRPSFDRKKARSTPSQVRRAFWAWTHQQHGDGLTPNKGENQVTRKKVLLATATIKHPNLTPTQIDAAPAFAMSSSFAMSGMQTARDLLRSTN